MRSGPKLPLMVAGVDVGGARKGFHAVALKDGAYHSQRSSKDAAEIAEWCRDAIQAQVIAIDAPCCWRSTSEARLSERQLLREGITCFLTPTRDEAVSHPTNYYGWMLNGEALFHALAPTHPLCQSLPLTAGQPCCFETFPHAITQALSDAPTRARDKRVVRRGLLALAGVATDTLTNIDLMDAALCALAAHFVAVGSPCRCYGETDTGLIVVPEGKPMDPGL